MTDTPVGFCRCGCGERTTIFNGEPRLFVQFHHIRMMVPLFDKPWREGSEYSVEDRGYETPCWVWQRTLSHHGYGVVVSSDTRRHLAHRVSFKRANGSLEQRNHVHHKCEVIACVNPDHLEELTPREHNARHGRAVLGMDAAREIRRRATAGESRGDLAREFGVTYGAVKHIMNGLSYAEDQGCLPVARNRNGGTR